MRGADCGLSAATHSAVLTQSVVVAERERHIYACAMCVGKWEWQVHKAYYCGLCLFFSSIFLDFGTRD